MKRRLLVLDLDETLIFSTEVKLDMEEAGVIMMPLYWGAAQQKIYVYKRPNLDDFLKVAFEHFDVGIWTAGSRTYADHVLQFIMCEEERKKLKFVFTSERCVYKRYSSFGEMYYDGPRCIKPLKKVKKKGYTLDEMIVIDDLPSTYSRNYGCAIPIKPFVGWEKDDELKLLAKYLVEKVLSSEVQDWRRLPKRYWRYDVGGE
jgi:TFIIF-interacting CTD phosphatase-like protein